MRFALSRSDLNLVQEMDDVRSTGEKKTDKRQVYERNLHKLGLVLEHVDGNVSVSVCDVQIACRILAV